MKTVSKQYILDNIDYYIEECEDIHERAFISGVKERVRNSDSTEFTEDEFAHVATHNVIVREDNDYVDELVDYLWEQFSYPK